MTAFSNMESIVYCDYGDCYIGFAIEGSKSAARTESHKDGWVSRRGEVKFAGVRLLDFCPAHAEASA